MVTVYMHVFHVDPLLHPKRCSAAIEPSQKLHKSTNQANFSVHVAVVIATKRGTNPDSYLL